MGLPGRERPRNLAEDRQSESTCPHPDQSGNSHEENQVFPPPSGPRDVRVPNPIDNPYPEKKKLPSCEPATECILPRAPSGQGSSSHLSGERPKSNRNALRAVPPIDFPEKTYIVSSMANPLDSARATGKEGRGCRRTSGRASTSLSVSMVTSATGLFCPSLPPSMTMELFCSGRLTETP